MSWLTAAEFRTFHVTESATETTDEAVEECLESAKDLIANLCGEAVIDETAQADDTVRKTKQMRRAQRKLAYRELLEFMSSRSRDGGLLETERDANGDTTNKYVPYAEIKARRESLYSEAIEIIEIYLEPEDVVKSGYIPLTTGRWF